MTFTKGKYYERITIKVEIKIRDKRLETVLWDLSTIVWNCKIAFCTLLSLIRQFAGGTAVLTFTILTYCAFCLLLNILTPRLGVKVSAHCVLTFNPQRKKGRYNFNVDVCLSVATYLSNRWIDLDAVFFIWKSVSLQWLLAMFGKYFYSSVTVSVLFHKDLRFFVYDYSIECFTRACIIIKCRSFTLN